MGILKTISKVLLFLILAAILFFLVRLLLLARESQNMQVASTYNMQNNSLAPCSDKPNCVSSFAPHASTHYIPAISLNATQWSQAKAFFDHCNLLSDKPHYVHYACATSAFGFVDDVELLYLPETNELHMRSQSRVGYSDLGANRDRINELISHLKFQND